MTATIHSPADSGQRTSDTQHSGSAGVAEQELLARVRKIGPIISEHAETIERERRVSRPVLDAIAGAGLQSMFTPKSLGGLEVDPVTCTRIVEEVAHFDSAAGWALQSGNVNAWWASRLPERGVDEIYGSNASTFVAAAFHPPQHAVEVEGGYRVSGRAPLASNIHDSEWILFGAFIFENGQPRMTPFGPEFIAVILRTSEVQIVDTWRTLGMRGTDSNDAAFKDVFVPSHRTLAMTPQFTPGRHFTGPLYRFPAVPIIALFSVGVLLATARNAISAFRDLAVNKVPMGTMKTVRDRGSVQSAFAEAEGMLRSARSFFYDTLGQAWARTLAGDENSLEHKADLLLAGVTAVKSATKVTDMMHLLAGTSGIYTASPLERYFRDAHTLRNHGFISESKLESVGQVYLGLSPDFQLIGF